MEQITLLEMELQLMQDTIIRLKIYKKAQMAMDSRYMPSQSLVVGELKHRSVSLKQRLTLIANMNTNDIFNSK
jgi:hypothetical protein